VIAASLPVNTNVATGAVIRAKRGTSTTVQIYPGVHKLLANYQTGYKFRPISGWNGRIGSQPFVYNALTKSTQA